MQPFPLVIRARLTFFPHQSLVKKDLGLKTEEDLDNPNFLKRYKWAFRPPHPAIRVQDVLIPNQRDFISDCRNLQV
jgi:hypothetical protein